MRYVAGFVSLVCAALTAASLAPGCSNSSEGQPCSTLGSNMGNDDCQSGLTCTLASQLNGGGYTKDVCCPTDRSQATTTICQLPSNPIAEAGAFPDVAAPVDAGMEAESPDAPASDATTDAMADSGKQDGCVPKTCAQLGTASDGGVGTACGAQNDGCGHALECTATDGGSVCGSGTQCLNGSCSSAADAQAEGG